MSKAFDDVKEGVEAFVAEQLDGYEPRKVASRKLIRDPVIGFTSLLPHEVAIVDSPVVQRLRRIRQTALAYQVYPGANHSRFEHSVGVAHRAAQMTAAINDQARARGEAERVSHQQTLEVRMAALLHDVGHGMFSHLSESIFAEHFRPALAAIEPEEDGRFFKKGVGEILSYLIVTSPSFVTFADAILERHGVAMDLTKLASYFFGKAQSPDEQFLAEMISGAFDADKLDYFERDCHYTGIRAEIDIDRILGVIDARELDPSRVDALPEVIEDINPDETRLVILRSGVPHVEQIIFNKLILFSSVYHHHKIRALECAVRSVFRKIWSDPSALNDERLRFPTIASMLSMTDEEFWVRVRDEPSLRPYALPVSKWRQPPMRALALDAHTLDRDAWPRTDIRRGNYHDLAYRAADQRRVAEAIQQSLDSGDQDYPYGVWFDMPAVPPVTTDASQTWIWRGDAFALLTSFFPEKEWIGAYTDNKLTAHVFFDPPEEPRRRVGEAALSYLNREFGLVAKPIALEMCFKDD